jgi:peptidoglycan/xylan/chitin deacetylase (PgdA/CDA1 family)
MLGLFSKYVYLGAAQRRLFQHGPAILTYHRIGKAPPGAPDPFLYDTARELDAHLTRAQEAGLKLVSLGEAVHQGNLRQGCLAVTFDDGCVSVLQEALPVLQKHKVRAIQFIVSGRIGGLNDWDLSKNDVPERLMDKEQIRDWLAAGMEIGSHSHSHRNLRKLKSSEAREEIFGSKARLEDVFGVAIHHFAFPYGGWRRSEVRDLVKQSGYESAVTTAFGVGSASADLTREAGYQSACTADFGVSMDGAELWSLRRITPLTGPELVHKVFHRLMRKVRGL